MIDAIFSMIEKHGDQTYGEDVTQMEHVLQCGHLARESGAPDTLIAAALLHDIGQFIADSGHAAEQRGIDARHEASGARFLAPAFPPAVVEPVRLHVAAKRYLCAVEPTYRQSLSPASELSLRLQGGPMDAAEIAAFRRAPFWEEAVRLRRYDDAGKRENRDVPGLRSYRPLLESLMRRHANGDA